MACGGDWGAEENLFLLIPIAGHPATLSSPSRKPQRGLLHSLCPRSQELCLYTLGNLIVESEAVRRQLLPQGIVPALATCIQSPHVAVLEALGYALSQLLQAKEAPERIIP